jgi:hypothetical protein
MVFTRLINLSTFELEEFEIGAMPPYVAASHVWAENLFPVSEVHSIAPTPGMRLILSALGSYSFSEQVPRYCWVDTWCIDQSSEEDKRHQMPRMGDVYGDAVCVIVTVLHSFTFMQEDWDSAIQGCREILDIQALPNSDRRAHPRYSDCLTPTAVRALLEANTMLLEVAMLPWYVQFFYLTRHKIGSMGLFRN